MITLFTTLTWIVLTASTYISIYYLLMLLENRKRKESPQGEPAVTVVVPAYNEEENIYESLESIYDLDYPKDKLQVVFVDDGSRDGTLGSAKRFAREHADVRMILVRHRRNKGKAAALNTALRMTKTPYFVTMDSDSFVKPDALRELLRYAGDNAVVTPAVIPKRTSKRLDRLQAIEYIYGNYLANMLSGFDAQMVAPGPFSLFKTKVLRDIGGFDETSPTEDLEIVYRIRERGYRVGMNYRAIVKTDTPTSLWDLIRQRRRWHLGFFDTVEKHREFMMHGREFAVQTFLKALFFSLSAAFIGLFIWGLYKGVMPFYNLFKAVGFDLLPYLQNLEFRFDLLGIDPQVIFYTSVAMVITLFFMMVSFGKSEELKVRPLDAIIFLISYGFALSVATVMAAASWIRRDYKW